MTNEDKELQYWADKASALARENQKLREENNRLKKMIELKDDQNANYREKLDAMKKNRGEWKQKFYDQCEMQQAEIESVKNEVKTRDELVNIAKKNADYWEKHHDEMVEISKTEITRASNLKSENVRLKHELATTQEALALNIKQLQKMGRDYEKVAHRLSVKRAQYKSIAIELGQIPQTHEEIKKMAFDLKVSQDNLNACRQMRKNSFESASKEIGELRKEVIRLSQNNEDGKKFSELEKKYDQLHDIHQDALKQIRPLEEQVEELEDIIESNKHQIIQCESSHDQLAEQYADYRNHASTRIDELQITVTVLSRLLGKG